MGDTPCWSNCDNCSTCVDTVLNMTGPAMHSSNRDDSLAQTQGATMHLKSCDITCRALAIATGTDGGVQSSQKLARIMQLSDVGLSVSRDREEVQQQLDRVSARLNVARYVEIIQSVSIESSLSCSSWTKFRHIFMQRNMHQPFRA